MQLARRVAGSDCTVLVAGESGTARKSGALHHAHSQRARRVFAAINCAAIPENARGGAVRLERGASPAPTTPIRKIRTCQGGTLLLDEISRFR